VIYFGWRREITREGEMATVRACEKAETVLKPYRNRIVALERKVPVLDGFMRRYARLDNAASTPCLKLVLDKVNRFMNWYSSVHRGSRFDSTLSSTVYDQARQVVKDFAGADSRIRTVIFTKNASEALNMLGQALQKSARGEYKGSYRLCSRLGEFLPEGFSFDCRRYFQL
jgi:selenocysteine lyase/cysteine desulfurase